MLTIVRHDLGARSMIVGTEISPDEAEALLDSGVADPGPDRELPAGVYLHRACVSRRDCSAIGGDEGVSV